MTIRVERTTVGDATFASVGRLRYAVYADEEQQVLPAMDHGRRTLVDALDPSSFVYAAIDEGVVVGTLRLTPVSALPRDDARDLRLRTPCLPVPENRQLFAGRLMVAPSHRGGTACLVLFATAYREALANGFEVVHAECNPRHLPLYESVGCRVSGAAYCDAIYGLNVRLILLLRDFDHFARRRSPLRAPAGTRRIDPRVAEWADRSLAPWNEPLSLRLKEIARQERLAAEIRVLPGSAFAALSTVDLRRALRSASLFELAAGTEILRPESACTEAFVVIEGEVRWTALHAARGRFGASVGRGGIFNETALLRGTPSTGGWSAVASTDTRLLVLSAESFAALRRSRSTISNVVEAGLRQKHAPRGHRRADCPDHSGRRFADTSTCC